MPILGFMVALMVGLACAGCGSAPAPMLDDDIEAFNVGIGDVLKIGMPIGEARKALRARLPEPSMDTEVTAPVPSQNVSNRTRRFMIGWPTFTPGTTFVLTIFCDRDGKIMRWTTGPLTENR